MAEDGASTGDARKKTPPRMHERTSSPGGNCTFTVSARILGACLSKKIPGFWIPIGELAAPIKDLWRYDNRFRPVLP